MGKPDETQTPQTSPNLPAKLSSIGRTHEGKRRAYNEDSYLDRPDIALWAVADGVGGWARGDYASRLIVDHLDRQRLSLAADAAGRQVLDSLQEINEHLTQVAARGESQRMASTVVALLMREDHYHCIWAGDSRCYLLRDGKMSRISKDHSRVQDMVDLGLLTDEQAETHPDSNIITRAIGAAEVLELDHVSEPLMNGDRFLLCSDGLTKHVPDKDLIGLWRVQRGRALIETLLDLALSRGGTDNITIVSVDIDQV